MISNKMIRRVFIFCSFFMATKDLFTAIVLTIVFVILINEVFGTELDEDDSTKKDEDKKEVGSSTSVETQSSDMSHEHFTLLDSAGRLQIPAEMRETYRIGGRVKLVEADGRIIVVPAEEQ